MSLRNLVLPGLEFELASEKARHGTARPRKHGMAWQGPLCRLGDCRYSDLHQRWKASESLQGDQPRKSVREKRNATVVQDLDLQ